MNQIAVNIGVQMKDIIIILTLIVIIGSVIFYIRWEKKRGCKCIGCPYAKQCSKTCRSATKLEKDK